MNKLCLDHMMYPALRITPLRQSTSTIFSRSAHTNSKSQSIPPARLLDDLRTRIGKCITFGLTPPQTANAGSILKTLAHDWRALLAGSEGFLTSRERRGLYRHSVVWGEMDSMGHVNNVMYNRYAESARVNWVNNYATYVDPAHRKEWLGLATPEGDGMILRSIRTDFKFVGL